MNTNKFSQTIYRYETSHHDKSIGTKRLTIRYETSRPRYETTRYETTRLRNDPHSFIYAYGLEHIYTYCNYHTKMQDTNVNTIS